MRYVPVSNVQTRRDVFIPGLNHYCVMLTDTTHYFRVSLDLAVNYYLSKIYATALQRK